MRMRFVFAVLSLLSSAEMHAWADPDSLLNALLVEIRHKEVYVNERVNRIDSLRSKLQGRDRNTDGDVFELYDALFSENRKFIYDSAFRYANELIKLAHRQKNQQRIGYARSQLGYVLVSSGFFKEAFDTLRLVRAALLPGDSVRAAYYALMARAYYDLGDFDNDHYYRDEYFRLGNMYTDSARRFCRPGRYYDLYLSRIKNIKTGNYAGGLQDSKRILAQFNLPWEEMAVNYFDLSHCYKMLGEDKQALAPLIRSALADIRAATKENAAMYTLARMLYENGDIEHAHIFIEEASSDAKFYGARQRQMAIAAIQPLIAAAKFNSVEAQRKRLLLFSLLLGALVLVVIAFAMIISKQLRRLKLAELALNQANQKLQHSNHELREANRIKEEYIGYYFNINAEYLNKIEAFKKAIDQKLMSRKYDELRFTVDNINLKREREELSYSFDRVFINLFPGFIDRFNSLFDQKDRFVLKEGHLMNTEMRIFALIRMGINDPEKIARILGYSVNTIYAYKTRVKSKSLVPNDEFEHHIMEIETA